MDPFPIREGVCRWPITPIPSPPRRWILTLLCLLLRPCMCVLGRSPPPRVVTFHGVSRDIKLNRGCRILRRLHHVQHRRVETIRLIQRRRYRAGMANAVGTLLVTVTAAAAGLAVAGL